MSMSLRGKHHSEETRKKISKSHIGKRHSEETKKKLSMARIGKSSWNKGKPMSEETRKKISISHSGEKSPVFGTHWWNNGIVSKQKRECPGEGWVIGRLKLNKHK